MSRPVTLFTGQWADLPFETICEKVKSFGYDGVELACWGDHFDVTQCNNSKAYAKKKWEILIDFDLDCWSISNHLVGQACRKFFDAKPKIAGSIKFAPCVNGFTGSSIWHSIYAFPPTSQAYWDKGFKDFGKRFTPILNAYDKVNVNFGLEVHPTEIAFDIASAERAINAVNGHKRFGFNYDPSHLRYQGVDYVKFIRQFANRIYHVHMKDAWWGHGDGTAGVFGGHTDFADPRRFWDFRSLGHGDIEFEEIIVALNDIGYAGPLSVEWEDSRMDREFGAEEACAFVRAVDFPSSEIAFDAQFDR